MKATFFGIISLFTLFIGALAVPAQVDKRADPTALIQSLYSEIQQYTSVINSTAASVNSDSSDADKTAAGDTITSAISSINSAVVSTTSQVQALGGSKRDILAARQDTGELATLIENLLLDISGALNNVISSLGLSKWSSFDCALTSDIS